MKNDVFKRARYIDKLFSRAKGLPGHHISDDEIAKEEGLEDLINKYLLPREMLALYFEKTRQLGGKRGIGLNKKSIIAVGWGNLISKSGHRMNWGMLEGLYYWLWDRMSPYKCYEEWAPVDGLEDYLKIQYHRYKLAGGLDQYLLNLEPLLENKDEKQTLQFCRGPTPISWTCRKV